MNNRFNDYKIEIRAESDEAPADISGVAAPFYDPEDERTTYQLWEGAEERILPSAFDELSRDVYATFNHDDSKVLGRVSAGTLDLLVDEVGLRYKITGSRKSYYRDLLESINRGDVAGSSFAFLPTEERWIEGDEESGQPDVRELVSVTLFELGPVTNPAYEASTSGSRDYSYDDARVSFDAWQLQLAEKRDASRQQEFTAIVNQQDSLVETLRRSGIVQRLTR